MSEPRVRVWRGVPSVAIMESLNELPPRTAHEFATTWYMRREDAEEDARGLAEMPCVESGTITGDQLMSGAPNFYAGWVTILPGAVDVDQLERVG